jgi:predicted RNase H-like HicB family nuclease
MGKDEVRETVIRHPAKVLGLTFLMYPCEEAPEKFVAHCLELDVVAVGDTKPAAIDLLKELIEDLMNEAAKDNTLEKVIHPAPRQYWEKLAKARRYRPPQRVIDHRIKSRAIRDVGYALAR